MADILLLEDNAELRFTFQDVLSTAGHEVISVSTSREALNALRAARPDLVVLDLMIGTETNNPVIDYLSFTAQDLPVIIVSGQPKPWPASTQSLMRRPNVAVLHKPASILALTAAVDAALAG